LFDDHLAALFLRCLDEVSALEICAAFKDDDLCPAALEVGFDLRRDDRLLRLPKRRRSRSSN